MAEPSLEDLRAHYEPRLRYELADLNLALTSTRGDCRPVELDQSVERLSRMDTLQGHAVAAGVEARRHARVRATDGAIERPAEDE